MGWRDRVRKNIESGAYEQKGPSAFEAFATGFATQYASDLTKDKEAKRKAEAEALAKAKEQEKEDLRFRQQAEQLAAEIFPEAPTSQAAIDYAYTTIKNYEGNIGNATTRLEKLREDDRLEILGPKAFSAADSTLELFSDLESGEGGYDALLNQAQNGPFQEVRVSEMSMADVLKFSSKGSEYHSWSIDNVPENTYAGQNNLAATPMGMYQFVGTTLADLKKRGAFDDLGISDETKFDKSTQDALFTWAANDALKTAKTDEEKRTKLRGIWEGFKKASDEQLDGVIKDIETGTFTEPSEIVTRPIQNTFDVGAELASLTYDKDGLNKLELLKARVLAEEYDLTESQRNYITLVETRIKEKIGEEAIFDYSDFLEENRLQNDGDIMGALAVVENMGNDRFRRGEAEKLEYIQDLKDRLGAFNDVEQAKMLQKAAADKDPLTFYARKEDGTLSLTPQTVQVTTVTENGVTTTKALVLGTNEEVDLTKGKLVPPEYDAGTFLKIYNKPLMDASNIVEGGVAGITNLLEYRKLTADNPSAFNDYLNWTQSVGDNIENLGSTFATMVAGGRTYQEVEVEIFSQLRDLTGPRKEIFARQLQAAYDLARLNESKGQGLSDRELKLNLESVGFGETRAEGALRKINIAVDRYIVGVESRRRGIVNGMRGDDDYRQAVNTGNFGRKFSDLVLETVESNETLAEQLTLANSRDTTVAQRTVIKTGSGDEGDGEEEIPTITTKAERDALASGTKYKDPNGVVRTKK